MSESKVPDLIQIDFDYWKAQQKFSKSLFGDSWLRRGFGIDKGLYQKLNDGLKLAKHQTQPISFTYRRKVMDQFIWVYFKENCMKYCDFEQSEFIIYNKGPIEINSLEHLWTYRPGTNIKLKKFVFNKEWPGYDVFGLFVVDPDVYFSENVKRLFEAEKIKDVEFKLPYFELG